MRAIRFPIFVVQPYERGIQETLGKYSGFIMPGMGLQIPLVQKVRVRDIREHTMDIPPQPPGGLGKVLDDLLLGMVSADAGDLVAGHGGHGGWAEHARVPVSPPVEEHLPEDGHVQRCGEGARAAIGHSGIAPEEFIGGAPHHTLPDRQTSGEPPLGCPAIQHLKLRQTKERQCRPLDDGPLPQPARQEARDFRMPSRARAARRRP